mmetsp:Transcript_73349/g.237562  ORF Transcript_73349/g.237562 Transcript_73349/m.237562 type:complete len:1132 (+) Transcript_73349:17-3412(+)
MALISPSSASRSGSALFLPVQTPMPEQRSVAFEMGEEDMQVEPWSTFETCKFQHSVMRVLKSFNFAHPTPIQARCWPIAASGRDIVGVSSTGSGKTLAFMVPSLDALKKIRQPSQRLAADKVARPGLLVIAPTRELALQILQEGEKVSMALGLRSAAIYGGAPHGPQISILSRGIEWAVATPGRLIDFLQSHRLSLADLRFLVLDEADRMLDQGFEPQLREVMTHIPQQHQTLMFTATWSAKVQQLASQFLTQPAKVQIGSSSTTTNQRIHQKFETCRSEREKIAALVAILGQRESNQDRAIVFVNTKVKCADLQGEMFRRRLDCVALHGDMDQSFREKALLAFRERNPAILVATDVAARGLDVSDVKVVINYDVAVSSDDHVHRIGRTGRAGANGLAVTLIDPSAKQQISIISDVASAMEDGGQPIPDELHSILAAGPRERSGQELSANDDELDKRSAISGYTHNTGLTHPEIELQGHQLARILASDEKVVEETLRRGLRFMNVERSKALDDRYHRPKWRIRRLVPWKELEAAGGRHTKGQEALAALVGSVGDQPLGIVHAIITDLYDPTTYIATSMFEIPQLSEQMFQLFDQVMEMMVESDDVEFARQAVTNQAFQQALKAMWESGDTDDEFYWQTFSKMAFPSFNKLPLLHYLCEDGSFTHTVELLLKHYSAQTAQSPWHRLVDVEFREKQYGNTPFHICAYAGHYDILKLLVHHAEAHRVPLQSISTTKGETALEVAEARGNMACRELLAPFFPGARRIPGGVDAQARESVIVVDGPDPSSAFTGAARVTRKVDTHLSVKSLASCVRELVAELGDVPELILIKHVHLIDTLPMLEDMLDLLSLAKTASSLTLYHCTCESLQVGINVLHAMEQLYKADNPAWERVFFLPVVRSDPSEEEKSAFTAATQQLIRCLQSRAQMGNLRLHSFGRDGSAGYAFPRSLLTEPCIADMMQGVFHVNTFVVCRRRLEQKLQQQDSKVSVRKRSQQGRSVSPADLEQLYFFAVKWAALDRFYYRGERVDISMAEDAAADGLRAAVDAESFLNMASECMNMWTYPLTAVMPDGIRKIYSDYMAALDLGLWASLEHHRMMPSMPKMVQELYASLAPDHQKRLLKVASWIRDHDHQQSSA